MAKATATCTCATCGDVFTVSATKYNRREANQWEEWASTYYDECTECWKKRKDAERQAENAAAKESAEKQGWPALTGSEKQVAWANSIREKSISKWRSMLKGDAAAAFEEFLPWLLTTRSSAVWWIDHRDVADKFTLVCLFKEWHESKAS